MIAAAVVVAVFLLYVLTYASIPAGDGYWALNNIDRADLELLFNPPSLLTQLGFFGLRRLADAAGLRIGTLTIIQTVNALAAGVGAAVLGATVRALGGSTRLGLMAAGLLAVSFGYWQFADGELQLLSLVVLILAFWLIVRARVRGAWNWRLVAGIALLNSLAALLRQENVIFGFAAVALLVVGRPWRPAVRDALVYTAVGAAGTWTAAVLIGLAGAPGVATVPDAVRWYLWIFRVHVGATQDFQGFEHSTKFDVPRVIKGQMTALVVGTQAVADSLRERALLRHPTVVSLVSLTALAYALMVALVVQLRRLGREVDRPLLAAAIGCSVWVLAYKLLLHAWLWPTVTKYQVVTVPPLVLLLVLGAVAAERAADRRAGRLAALLAGLVVVVFLVDLTGGILPWRRYGEMKVALERRRVTEFRADDLFVSSESGIDPIFARLYRGGDALHVSVKDIFVQHPAPEAFATIRTAIERHVAAGHRVFVYNLVPGPYSLVGINQSPARAGAPPLQARDFEAFLRELQAAYVFAPVFTYWEEGKAPLYLFGERQEPFFEVRARS